LSCVDTTNAGCVWIGRSRAPDRPRLHAMHPSDAPDLGLLQRIVARDTAALADLYDRRSRLLFGLILRIVRDRAETEEILQEVFLRVWTRAELYDPRMGGPTPWLVRLARNCAIDRLRARRIRDAVNTPALDESAGEAALSSADIRTPETAVLDAERRGTVIDALAGLPAEQRRLIEAAFFEGYTHSELAKRFALPLGTVKTRIRAGMIAMRQRMEHAV
jgi:RNA polymerase sigma-70 factor, ECF subfamily